MAEAPGPGRTDAATRCGPGPSLTSPPARPAVAARARRGAAAWQAGLQAEDAACRALRREGWTILMRRARTPAGEIDIVAELRPPDAPSLLAFIEVKARPALRQAAAALSPRQQARLLDAAGILLARHPAWMADGVRFDLLLVDPAGAVRRIADAFRQERPD